MWSSHLRFRAIPVFIALSVLSGGGTKEPAAARQVRDKKKEKKHQKEKPDISKEKQALLYAQAEESYKKAIELDSKNDGAFFALAELYRKQGRKAEAESYYERALELSPGNTHYFEGMLLLYPERTVFGDWNEYQVSEEWIEIYRDLLISVKPQLQPYVRMRLIKMLLKFKRREEAVEEFEKLPDEFQWQLLPKYGDFDTGCSGYASR